MSDSGKAAGEVRKRPWLRRVLASLLLLALAIAAIAFSIDVPLAKYRTLSESAPECAIFKDGSHLLYTDSGATENDEQKLLPGNAWRCWLQRHVLRPAPNSPGAVANPAIAPEQVPQHCGPDRYTLGFVEFDEEGLPLVAGQKDAVLDALRQHREQNYVVVFVHGWRHDAAADDLNLRSFRRALAYTASFLRQRCVSNDRYRAAAVTGIYLGWRGRSAAESLCVEPRGEVSWYRQAAYFVCTLPALATVWSRKAVADKVADGVRPLLKEVSAIVADHNKNRPGFFERDKLLITGHSFGGNVLATALESEFARIVAAHDPTAEMQSPVGDMVVLFNPASEAAKWTALQRALEKKTAGLTSRFHSAQRPIYMAMTSTCDWYGPDIQSRKDPKPACDTATGWAFPLAFSYRSDAESKTTIGHLVTDGSEPVGATHEFEVNGTTQTDIGYRRANQLDYAKCLAADGWLYKARQRAARLAQGHGWDAGDLRTHSNHTAYPPEGPRYALAMTNDSQRIIETSDNYLHGGINTQFRNRLERTVLSNKRSVVNVGYPLWNVRALDTAIAKHNNFWSYETWCAINQFVMDDVTAAQ